MSIADLKARNRALRADPNRPVHPEHAAAAVTRIDTTAGPLVSRQTSDANAGGVTCRHFERRPLEKLSCGSCLGKWVYPCEVYGQCSPRGEYPGVKRCDGCSFFTPEGADVAEPNPEYLILHNSLCPGDVTVMTAAVESLHRAHPGAYVTAYTGTAPEIFDFHPHIVKPLPEIDGRAVPWRTIEMHYPLINECDARPVHFMQGYTDFLSTVLERPVPLLVNRPHVYLSEGERHMRPQVHEAEPGVDYWLVNAGFKDDYPAKWWGTSNFQSVVDRLRGVVRFVQIGEAHHNHPPLRGVIDMRGRTTTRQLIRMVAHAAGGLGPSSFLQHLCAAFEKPYVLLAGGREPVAWQHYPRQATLATIGITPCSFSRAGRSCWKATALPRELEEERACELPVVTTGGETVTACLGWITPEMVAAEIRSRYTNRTTLS